jgi:hypothetical protein
MTLDAISVAYGDQTSLFNEIVPFLSRASRCPDKGETGRQTVPFLKIKGNAVPQHTYGGAGGI